MIDLRSRPRTPHDFVKSVRYEDAENGLAPLSISSLNSSQPSSPQPTSTAQRLQPSAPHAQPSPASANPDHPAKQSLTPRTSALSSDVKRDSAIAPSVSATSRTSNAESHLNYTTATSAPESAPTANSVNGRESPAPVARTRSPSFWRKASSANRRVTSSPEPLPSVQRVQSFKGLPANIPSGNLDGISLEDLRSDDIHFSNRGSLIFGGKKMNELIAAQGTNGNMQPFANPRPVIAPEQGSDAIVPGPESQLAAAPSTPPKTGLVSGRRKPSVQMLQAALQGGRVLSAEEISFSLKVRSQYEYGDERAADWTRPMDFSALGKSTPDSQNGSTPDSTTNGINVDKTRDSGLAPSTAAPIHTRYSREVHEIAGGIEDWQDVNGLDVDRYGFIDVKRTASRLSNGSETRTGGMQRVATALRLEAEQPRQERSKLRRRISSARSARSAPPKKSGDGGTEKSPGSIRSFRSSKSNRRSNNPFQSRDQRAVSGASTMLHSPIGLADIPEQKEDFKKKKREWSREQKWQKMAKPTQKNSPDQIGGGMRFDFDINDPKLVDRTWKGIPDKWRATAWHSFLLSSAKRRGSYATDEELTKEFFNLQEMSSADDVQIDVDVPRTINMHIMFRRRYRGGQRLLFRVLHAISLHFPDTGYVQGMACLAATLLCYYDEEMAFIMMTRLWQLRGLEQLFQNGFDGLMAALKDFEDDWLIRNEAIKKQLEDLGISSTAYGTRWYLTLFNMSVPFPAQLRVWDVFMLLGDAPTSRAAKNVFGGADLDVVHATSAALIDALRDIILDSDFETAMKVLTSWVPIQNEDKLMDVVRAEWNMRKKRG